VTFSEYNGNIPCFFFRLPIVNSKAHTEEIIVYKFSLITFLLNNKIF